MTNSIATQLLLGSLEAVGLLLDHNKSDLEIALAHLGRSAAADRCYVFEVRESQGEWWATQLAEWVREGVRPEINNPDLQDLPLRQAGFGRWVQLFLQNQTVGGLVADMPTAEQPMLLDQDITSILLVPVWDGPKLWGFLGLDDCQNGRVWSADEQRILRLVASALGGALRLENREAYFRSLLGSTQIFLIRTNLQGEYTYANPAFLQRFDLSHDLLGQSYFATVVPQDIEVCNQAVLQALQSPGMAVSVELGKRHANGKVVQTAWELVAILNREGVPYEIQAVGWDISARKAEEQRRARWENFHQKILEVYRELLSEGLSNSTYDRLLQTALSCIPAAQAGSITLLHSDNRYHFVATAGYNLMALQQVALDPAEPLTLSGHSKATIFTADDLAKLNQSLDRPRRQVLEDHGRAHLIQSLISSPVYVGGVRRAYLYLDNFDSSQAFGDLDLQMAEEFAAQVGLLLQRFQLESHIEFLAYHDTLTQLPNRLLFLDRLEQTLAEFASRPQSLKPVVLWIDLDNFKAINDMFGHAAGDQVLRRLTQRMLGVLRPADTVARQGGDEFLVLLPDLPSPDQAQQVAKRLLEALSEPIEVDGKDYVLTASIGIAVAQSSVSSDRLLREADLAMYRAKREGKNTYAFYSPELQQRMQERVRLEQGILRGIERGEFTVVFQPIIGLGQSQAFMLEALLRWQHPEHGVVSPAEFIPLAEERGLIHALGTVALNEACRVSAAYFNQGHRIRVSVNVSPKQMGRSDFVAGIQETLERWGLPPELLVIEITEAALMEDNAWQTLHQLDQLGLAIYLDDFGSGYSSLEYLVNLPVEALKIGQRFLRQLGDPPQDNAAAKVIQAVLALSRSLDMQVVVEGVESEAQCRYLIQQGFSLAQGYYFARPQPIDQLHRFLPQLPSSL